MKETTKKQNPSIKPDNNNKVDGVSYGYTAESNSQQIEEENQLLRQTVVQLRDEIDRYRRTPLLASEVKELIGNQAMIKLANGNLFLVEISSGVEDLKTGDHVLVEQKNLTIIRKLSTQKQFSVERYVIVEKPTTTWEEVGGLADQKREIQEVVELPLKKPELFKKVGIQPPKAVLLYGPPGTGKTLLAKAVANSTNSTFIEIVGSEMVQKFIGEGAKLVKEIFQLAREKAPAVIFIDELDAIASKRIEIGTSGEREVQRTFMQLLAEIDGFKPLGNVKIIGCTNRKDILDPAILRPGRIDRHIFVPVPDTDGRKAIFKIHSKDMTLEKGIAEDKIIAEMEGFSGAEIRAVCTEAGYFAIRENRTKITTKDFLQAVEKVRHIEELEDESEYMDMFM